MKNKFFALLIMIIAIFTIGTVQAEDINKFYATADQNVKMVDKVIGDSAIAGALVDIDGKIEGIGFIAGQTVNVNGEMDYGFVGGQNVKVDGEIARNIYIAGSTISFTEDSSVGRDTKIVGSDINLSGRFYRDVEIGANKVVISDKTIIDGNATIYADIIEIAGNVTINGSLKYNEDAKVTIKESASIKNIEKVKKVEKESKVDTKSLVLGMINLIVVILIFALLLPKAINKTNKVYDNKGFNKYAKNFLIGLLFLICIPIITLILLASNIGTNLGLIVGALYIIAIYLSYGLAGYVFGELILNRALKLNINKYLIIIIGIVLIKLLVLIPIIGPLVFLVCVSMGMATIWELVKEDTKAEEKKKETPKVSEAKRIKDAKKLTDNNSTKKNNKTNPAKTSVKKSSSKTSSTTKKNTPKKKTK